MFCFSRLVAAVPEYLALLCFFCSSPLYCLALCMSWLTELRPEGVFRWSLRLLCWPLELIGRYYYVPLDWALLSILTATSDAEIVAHTSSSFYADVPVP